MDTAENLINEWLKRVGKDGIEFTVQATTDEGRTLRLDFYPLLLMNTYHMYLWYDMQLPKTEYDIHQAFMRDPEEDWFEMRIRILEMFRIDLESPVWEIVGSRP